MIASQKIGKSFMGALTYNLKKLYHPDPEMRAEPLATNFASTDPAIIKQEVEMMKSMKPNLSRYVYHTSITLSLLINYTVLLYLYKKEIQLCQDQY